MEYQNRSPLDTIESRLSNIERRVYGKSNPSFREKEDAASEVIICNIRMASKSEKLFSIRLSKRIA